MKVNVFGKDIEVIVKKFDSEDQDKEGFYSYEDKTIYIDSDYSGNTNLLLHEIFHAMRDRLHIQMSDDLEEQLAQNFADVVTENFSLKYKNADRDTN